jgi:ATP-binding cassette subfamily B protein
VESDRQLANEGLLIQFKRVGRTFKFLKPVKFHAAVTIAVFIAYNLAEAIAVKLLKPAFNAIEHMAAPSGTEPVETGLPLGDWILHSQSGKAELCRAILILAAAKIVWGLLLWAKTWCTSWQSMSMVFYMRAAVYDRLQRVGFAFHDNFASGHLINRALSDLQSVRTFIMTGLNNVIDIVFSLIFYFIMLWVECSPKIALSALIPLPFWFWALRRFAIKSQPIYEAQTKASDKMIGVLTENIAGVHVIRAFATQDLERGKFGKAAEGVFSQLLDAVRLRVKMIPFIRGIAVSSNIALFSFGAILVQRKEMEIGQLMILGIAMNQILGRIQQINTVSDSYQQAVVSSKRLYDILDSPSNTPEKADAEPLLPGAGAVSFSHVSFSYEPGHQVLQDVSFSVPAGKVIALVGPTGAGKTTLAALLARFYDPDLGTIEIDGQDIRDLTLRSVREAVGYVFQDTFLFSDTIARNIAYGDLDASPDKIREAARIAQAEEFIERLPKKYDTMIGEYGASLSGGQKQRLSIARAILHNPRVLVMDDALASVDPETESQIRQGLERAMRGRTVFLITSRISTARRANRIVVIEHGKVSQIGTHDELMRQPGYYRDVATSQFSDEGAIDEQSHMDRMTKMSKRTRRMVHE